MDKFRILGNRIKHNLGLKILAVFSAFLIWVSIENYLDPSEVVVFYNVPVETINVSSLTSQDKIPEIIEGSNISVAVQARKSICDKLTKEDIIAKADFEKLSYTNTVPIDVSVRGVAEADVEIIRGNNQFMKLSLEDYTEKEYKVKVVTKGNLPLGYVVGSEVASPNVIKVGGSRMQISRIQEVVVEVDCDGKTGDFKTTVKPVVYDMNDDKMSSEALTIGTSEITVNISVFKTQTINLHVNEVGTPAEGYELNSVSFQPLVITVAGKDEDLKAMGNNFYTVIDVSERKSNVEETKDLANLIGTSYPDVMIVDEDTKLAITAYVSEQRTKQLQISIPDIELLNVPKNGTAWISGTSGDVVLIRAKKEIIDNINISVLAPCVELAGISKSGDQQLKVHFNEGDGFKIMADFYVYVSVLIEDKEANNEDSAELPVKEGQ